MKNLKHIIYLLILLVSFSIYGQRTTVLKNKTKIRGDAAIENTAPDSLLTYGSDGTLNWTKLTDFATKIQPLLSSGGSGGLQVDNPGISTSAYFLAEVNRSQYVTGLGNLSVDFSNADGYPATGDYGISSVNGFNAGSGNKMPQNGTNFGGHFSLGHEQTIEGYYNNIGIGTRNNITNGYAAVALGYGNTVNMTGLVGQGLVSGTDNTLNGYWASAIGSGLVSKWKGALVVGEGNVDSAESVAAADRPLFIVGNGEVSALSGDYGTTTSTSNAFLVRKTGRLEAATYGAGIFTGTPTFSLQVDANGNIIEGALGGGTSYSVFTCNVTQSGTTSIDIITNQLEDTLPGIVAAQPFISQRTGVGIYSLSPKSGLTIDPSTTTVNIKAKIDWPPNSGNHYSAETRIQSGVIYINTFLNGVPADGCLENSFFEVRVYP